MSTSPPPRPRGSTQACSFAWEPQLRMFPLSGPAVPQWAAAEDLHIEMCGSTADPHCFYLSVHLLRYLSVYLCKVMAQEYSYQYHWWETMATLLLCTCSSEIEKSHHVGLIVIIFISFYHLHSMSILTSVENLTFYSLLFIKVSCCKRHPWSSFF